MAFVDPDDLKPTSGFVDPDEVKPRTSLWEDVKIGYTDVANTLDTAGTLTWAGLGKFHGMSDEAYDEYAKNLKRRRKMRQEAANPEGREQGFGGKLTSLVGSLPGQIAALPFSSIETGMNALDAGESGTTTAKLIALDTLSSAAGMALPMFGGTLVKRMLKGGAANAGQEYLTREAMSRTAETPKMQEVLAPTSENIGLATIMGVGTTAMFGKNKPKTNKPAADTSNIDNIVQSAKAAENEVKIDMTDPGTRAAAYKYADDATVQRLEAALAKRNEPNPTISVDSQGRGFVGDEIDVKNQFDAQQALEDRQKVLEQDVSRQAGLDFNAAERARQENAPTGFEDYQQSLRDSAETRQPGDNTPMNFESPYPVDASKYPSVLADAPYQYEGGLDFTLADANPTNLKFRRRPLDASPEVDPMAKANELLAGSELARKRPGQKINRGPGRGQAGVLNLKDTLDAAVKAMRAKYGAPQDSLETPISPENISAKEQKVRKVKAASDILGTKLPEWTNVATEEEALAMGAKAKDIESNPYTRGLAPGNNYMAAYHKNPLLSFARKLFNDARGEAIKFSKQFVTAENGLSTFIKEMPDDQKLKVSELLRSLDKHQVDYTPELGQKIGLDANSMAFMSRHVEAGEAMWQWGQKTRAGQGVKDAPKRKGYTASMYSGDYFSLVTDKDGGVLGVIAAETPGEFAKAKAHYAGKFKGAKFSAETYDKARIKYKGSNRQALQFKDLSTILELISDGEGGFSKLQNAQHLDAVKAANKLYHFDAHNKRKKGVEGNLGNKPWLSEEQNARDRLDSVIRYYEEGAQYFALQKPLEQLRTLVARPELEHLKNTKEYLDDYVKNVEGTYLHDFGEVMNRAFNITGTVAEIATNKIPVVNNFVSPSNILKSSNWLKNKMSQMYMGWGNWVFLASQLMQPIQTGIPIMNLVGNRIGVDSASAMKDMTMAGTEFAKFGINKALKSMGVEKRLQMDPLSVEALEWGRLRGILDFTELERAYEGHKTDFGRGIDNVAEASMQIGESATRPPVFLAVVKMLSRVESDKVRLFETAENITNQIMADYHTWERPLMYNGLGVLSPHAGGLTTFKHNYMGTQALLAKELAKGNAAPIILSMMQMTAFAGIMGAPFYGEFDQIYQQLREWVSGERRSISQDFLENIPEYLKSGVVSSLANLNAQGKFSAADMVPDSLPKAAFPHLSGAYDIAENAAKAAMNPNETNVDNALVSATPSGWKQASKYGLQRDDEGWLIDKYGKRDVQRTDDEWKKAASTGLVPLDEATQRQRQFQNRKNETARKERMIDLSKKFSEAIINDANSEQVSEILNAYQDAGGDVPSLLKQIPRIQQEAQMSTQERLEGRPTTPQGVRRYEEYNR